MPSSTWWMVPCLLQIPIREKVLDPTKDKWITEDTYPGLLPYPSESASGIVGILQPGKAAFSWNDAGFQPPPAEDLVIYELLVRDFIGAHDWQTLKRYT